ncbi:MAG: M6 family metalloprotease domain-containing protein [Paludibacteraceae bacterium]|nr:M6 family metalloprotease domain-containing protein [Paludibacteraceae bacterium]
MKKIVSLFAVCIIAMMAYAVPAKRGWQTRTQADGTTIEVQQMGDEFYHYMINREGQQVREINGMYEIVGEAPTPAVAKARRAKGVARRQRKAVGTEPYLAPKGLLILANFSDSKYKATNTYAVMDSLINAKNCQVNKYGTEKFPSAAQYFSQQSRGAYNPVFDVYGPVTLSQKVSYYGTDGSEEGDDQYAANAIVEACKLADAAYDINWSDYDWNNDGEIDFVYVIYAGKGQADGGAATTIWPHNWDITSARQYGNCTYTAAQCKVGGKSINNYACSGELNGQDGSLNGISTFCHEFGHVLGLPDFYDTQYGTNYEKELTPNEWDIMDGGSYNGDGHCPPNYSPWEKYFFGWLENPIKNLGSEGAKLSLIANGLDGYQAYQVNASGKLQSATTEGLNYYFENRRQQGWDKYIPAEGLVIWKVNFSASAWSNNTPNNTSNNPKYTVVCSNGTKVGANNGAGNVFPYGSKNSWTGVTGKPLKEITKKGELVELIYIEEPQQTIDPFDVQWFSNGTLFETNKCTEQGKVVLPSAEPEACANGRVFIGWCADASYVSETTAPTLVKAGDAVEEGAAFYAVFAKQSGEGGAEETSTYTFTSKAWADETNSWTSTQDGNQLTANQGVQVTTGVSGAGAKSKAAFDKVSKVVVTYCTNASRGAGSIEVAVGSTKVSHDVTKEGGTSLRTLDFDFDKVSGTAAFTVTCTTNSIYVNAIEITSGGGASYSNYSTSCGGETAIEDVEAAKPAAFKTIREGRIVIVRGDEEFNITGERIR